MDADFWARLGPRGGLHEPLTRHARAVFDAASSAIHARGEPGFVNADRLAPSAAHDPALPVGSARFPARAGAALLGDISQRANGMAWRSITNPCGEVALPVTGGFCVVADVAPLLACPVPLEELSPGAFPVDVATAWDARVAEAIRIGVRFLLRIYRMHGIYDGEMRASNPNSHTLVPTHPFPQPNRHDAPWLAHEPVPCMIAVIDDVVVIAKHAIG